MISYGTKNKPKTVWVESNQYILIVILYNNVKSSREMRICDELRNTIRSQHDIIQREKIADLILINFILCLANE